MTLASRIGLGFHPTHARQVLDLIERAEDAGVGTFWAVMSPIDRDTLTILAAAAMQTERINLGTAVVPAFTRHPLALATQVLALEDLAPGRIRLGIGPSHQRSMIPAYGLPFERPLSQLREYLQILRPALQQGSFAVAGEFYRGEAELLTTPGTPVYISALGEKAFELAGEMADGAISWLCPPSYLENVALPAMRRGAERARRPTPPLIAHAIVAPTADLGQARASARKFLAYYQVRPYYVRMLAAAGFPINDEIPDDLIVALVISGDDRAIADGLLQRLDNWADELVVTVLPGNEPRASEDAFFSIISRL
ncbi:MAG: LLM class flavin-dependent oxidoreductase [Chloroflexi bacterium]|nr:LLM class flavin-dependent oxidoreductase [Chloroflexota bacterium]